MSGRVKKAAAPKKKANGYKMPPPIPVGEVINDTINKKKWRIGPSIGVGGFGEIYSACVDSSSPKKKENYSYVIKIEPHENGPLFVEKHFYIKNNNKADIDKFMQQKKLSTFGMPLFYGSGSHEFKGEKYRYLVLERYGRNVWDLFLQSGKNLPPTTVFILGLQMLDVLEYIHSKGYVHADIKGANILMGLKKGTENQAYLVDFGLASRVTDKEFKPDPKCAHNGTIEYTSRDAHLGVPTMRGDIEILGYNMLHWIVGELPWEKAIKQPKTVQTMKEAFMKNVRREITQHPNVPEALVKFFEYIDTLDPKGSVDYVKCKQIFETYLKSEGVSKISKLEWTNTKRKANKLRDHSSDEKTQVRLLKKNTSRENGNVKVKKQGRKVRVIVDENSENEEPEVIDKKNTSTANVDVKVKKQGRKVKVIVDENSENEEPEVIDKKNTSTANGDVKVKKQGRKVKVIVDENSENEEPEVIDKKNTSTANGDVKVKKQGRKARVVVDESSENEEPEAIDNVKPTRGVRKVKTVVTSDGSDKIQKIPGRGIKRKSSEPSVLVKIKKTKMVPKATPPMKKNHVNSATQTSGEKSKRNLRQVTFDSPVCAVIDDTSKNKDKSADSSVDVFEDSIVIEEKKVKPRRKLLSKEEVTVKKVVRKKVTSATPKVKSWKDSSTIVNGRSPPK